MNKNFLSIFTAAATAIGIFANTAPALASAPAHSDLLSTVPAAGSTIYESPKEIRLTFEGKLQKAGNKIVITNAKGEGTTLKDVMVDTNDTSVAAPVPAPLMDGWQRVDWTVLSEDGHAMKGNFTFTMVTPNVMGDVALNFAFKAGGEAVTCNKDIAGVGLLRVNGARMKVPVTKEMTATQTLKGQIADARFYVSNVRLISADGKETAVTLANDGKWQNGKVALVDFEDATGLCKDGGTPETHTKVVGTAPAGKYTGVAFNLGVPFEMNHADVAVAQSPLNVKPMWWNWQGGYKFVRIDLKTNIPAPKDMFYIHLGSTGCGDVAPADPHAAPATGTVTGTMVMTPTVKVNPGSISPTKPCKNPNLPTVRLKNFDPAKSVIVADLFGLINNVDISTPSPMPNGCMSGTTDKDCVPLFPNLGLSLKAGQCLYGCAYQKFFRVEAVKP
jgi:uncharacterized repeat protein (TIGR04052 family)